MEKSTAGLVTSAMLVYRFEELEATSPAVRSVMVSLTMKWYFVFLFIVDSSVSTRSSLMLSLNGSVLNLITSTPCSVRRITSGHRSAEKSISIVSFKRPKNKGSLSFSTEFYILFKDCCRSAQTRRHLLICGFFGLSNHTFFIT